jgi:hypothetical protein
LAENRAMPKRFMLQGAEEIEEKLFSLLDFRAR